ncbi:serine hydrolase [Nitrospira sp. Ecomares 2.1]
MKTLLILIGLFLVMSAHVAAYEVIPNDEADVLFKQMEKSIFLYDKDPYTISKAVEKNDVAGMSLAIIYNGKPVIHKWYGDRNQKKKEKTTADTIYQCASTSKMVSSLGFAAASRRGELSLDESVTDFNKKHPDTIITKWVDKVFKDHKSWPDDITPRRLLSHTAGLDTHGIANKPWLPSSDPLKGVILGRNLAHDAVKPIHEPGTKYDYSGGGYTVAEAMLEIATDKRFETYLQRNVLEPYGMNNSTFEDGSSDMVHLARGCSRGVCLYDVQISELKAAGGLLCHPVDYARLVSLMMNDGAEYLENNAGTQIIPKADIDEVLTKVPPAEYGLGVDISGSQFSHGGKHQGFATNFYAHSDKQVGIVVLVNGKYTWARNKEVYGAGTLNNAVVKAFKIAFGVSNESGQPLKPTCSEDEDCAEGQYCDKGPVATIGINKCKADKKRNETCSRNDVCGPNLTCYGEPIGKCGFLGTVVVGDQCFKDKECTSGKCEKDTCVCKSDGDCPNGQACYTPIGKANYCASTSKALGASCSKNSQCASDKCQQDHCVCKGDGDCPNGQACFTPVGKANYCASTSKALGATCSKNSECASDKCQQDKCVCKGAGDCPNGQACYTPVGKANYCASTSKALGASCTKDSQCASDKCEQDKCVCKSNGDCPNGQTCYTPIGKANYCASTSKALGASCTKDSQCASDKCEQDKCVCKSNGDCPNGQTCYTPVGKANYCASTSKALGASCSKNSQCASDKCEQGECVCQSDNDCPGSQKCKTPVTKKNYCTK